MSLSYGTGQVLSNGNPVGPIKPKKKDMKSDKEDMEKLEGITRFWKKKKSECLSSQRTGIKTR